MKNINKKGIGLVAMRIATVKPRLVDKERLEPWLRVTK